MMALKNDAMGVIMTYIESINGMLPMDDCSSRIIYNFL